MMLTEGDVQIDIDDDVDEKVLRVPEVRVETQVVAEKIADIARQSAPHESGDYAAGIVVQASNSRSLLSYANFRVFASDFKSAWIEFGIPSRGQPAHWILRRAAEAAGMKFRKRKG